MSTLFTYNGLLIENVRTISFTRDVVRTQDRGDYLHAHYVIHFEGMLSPYVNAFNQSGERMTTSNPAQMWPPYQTYNNIKAKLMQERKPLRYEFNGVAVVESPMAGYSSDANWGPHPIEVTVTRIDGGGAFIIQGKYETWLDENVTGQSHALRSHRWETFDDIDGDYMLTRTTQGTATFGADILGSRSADLFRVKFWPGVPRFMKREHVRVHLASDNRTIKYTIVDREKVLPGGQRCPATTLRARYRVSTQINTASSSRTLLHTAHVQVEAAGPRNRSRWVLFALAFRIAMAKLRDKNNKRLMIYETELEYILDARAIVFRASARLPGPPTFLGEGPHKIPMDDWRLRPDTDQNDIDIAMIVNGNGDVRQAPPLPGDKGCRGTLVYLLQSQIMRDDTDQTVAPPTLLSAPSGPALA